MTRTVLAVALAATALTFGAAVTRRRPRTVHPGKAGSPHVRTEWTIDGANLSIEYGRPSLKGRAPGKDIDPYDGREWRTGADEATTPSRADALKFGDAVAAGRHLHALHDSHRRHLAADRQQEDRSVGRAVSEGRRPGPRADDARQGAESRRAVDDFRGRHAGGRHAPHRLGHHPRFNSFTVG